MSFILEAIVKKEVTHCYTSSKVIAQVVDCLPGLTLCGSSMIDPSVTLHQCWFMSCKWSYYCANSCKTETYIVMLY